MTSFKGKTAVITGASSGIGESCARKFAASGARVVLAARSAEPLQRLVEELGEDVAFAVPTDVSDFGACERLLQEAKSRFGSIDILVNNAARNTRGPLEDLPVDEMLKMLATNLQAPMTLTRLVIPTMRAQGSGTVINVASLAGRLPLADEATYSTTKFGLRIFSFAVAEELRGTNVRVCVVSPGPVETGFILDESIIEEVPALVFSQPMSSADEIADLVLASASDGKRERTKPALSGKLATLSYLVPAMRGIVGPLLERKGAREKRKYIARRSKQ
jgi:short-subunit dehydrogenase